MNIYEHLLSIKSKYCTGFLILLDPDKSDGSKLPEMIEKSTEAGVDGFLIGGSLLLSNSFDEQIKIIKKHTSLPVIIFPGSLFQVSSFADAILFLILISGRNPDHLIGNQVIAAPIIKKMKLETISTGYMLIESGITTAAEFISQSKPIPRHKPDIAVAHSIAAEMLGLKLIYLDAGSGADQTVPEEMIKKITNHCSLPIIVGGGIRTPEVALKKAQAGASFIVTGNVIEESCDITLLREFVSAIHTK